MSKDGKMENRPKQNKTDEEKKFDLYQSIRKNKIREFKKKIKWYHILALAVVVVIILLFVIWHLLPKKVMNVAVLDKTIMSYSKDDEINKDNVYRKHRGFFWILNQQRFVKNDLSSYDYKVDYFGPMLDEEGSYDYSVELSDAKAKPDFLYLADAYGMGNDTYGHYNGGKPLGGGISDDDMSYINFAYESGAPIVAETTLFSSTLSDSVRAQLMDVLGVTPTNWIGRYIVDLEDFTDVPDWAVPLYEQQEGVEWRFTGPGILLVSGDDKIIILEQNTDFNSKDLLKIYINDEYKKEFGSCGKCNFYNWFELIEPNYGVESIATFEFDLNSTGMEKIREINKTPRFSAITRKKDENYAPVYFFAGDFNDYVVSSRYGSFLFSNEFYQFLSYDRQGDITNFFWRFFDPLIRRILKDTAATAYVQKKEEHKEVSRVNEGSFQIFEEENWKNLSLKAAAINADEPGKEKYSRDFTYYQELVSNAADLGINCIEAKTLLPPEFYAAISRHNKNEDNDKIYIIQRIKKPDSLEEADFLTEDGLEQWKNAVENSIKALHGEASLESEKTGKVSYFIDVSDCVLALCIDPQFTSDNLKRINNLADYSYSGEFVNNSTGINGFAAFLYDCAQSASYNNYGYFIPVSVSTDLSMLKGLSFVSESTAYVLKDYAADVCESYVYTDISLNNTAVYNRGQGSDTVYSKYDSLMNEITKITDNALISGISFSSVNAVFTQEAVTESMQGNALTGALTAVKDSAALGGIVYDLNDTWSQISLEMSKYDVSQSESYLWHNVCDRAQTSGVVALDSVMPDEAGLVLSDDDLAQSISMYSGEGYMYITLQLFEEIDYKENVLFLGIDTYQRNDGEYFYAKDFTPNSLSGMEYTLRFEDKQSGALYVTSNYNRSKGSAVTKESYTGDYDKVADLVYGGFTSADTQFYQTGSTINIRLPWNWLNVADPSKKLVINDPALDKAIAKTITTNGALISVMIGERKEGDLIYAFPQDKHDPGYKVFQWSKWEKVDYTIRQKESFDILKRFFNQY